MKLWNVFKMEMFKNWHDRVSLFTMLSLMCMNIIGGLVVSNLFLTPDIPAGIIMIFFIFSVFGSVIFSFVYPYRMARVDYRNQVMSLKIASGVSRVQYYFVKIASTLLFSLLSIFALGILPVLVVGMANDMAFVFEVADELVQLGFLDILRVLLIALFWWLASFATLMASVIIAKGRSASIFIFFGLTVATSIVTSIIRDIIVNPSRNSMMVTSVNTTIWLTLLQYILTTAVMGLIGILVIRKQDL